MMDILIFRTNITSNEQFKKIESDPARIPKVFKITIDLSDRDKVLRMEANNVKPGRVIKTATGHNFICEEMQ